MTSDLLSRFRAYPSTRVIPETEPRGGYLILHRGKVHWAKTITLAMGIAEYLEVEDRKERRY